MSLVFKWCNKISMNEAARERARTGTWSSTEPAGESSRHDSETLKSINPIDLSCLS